jgi:hypothetical protein
VKASRFRSAHVTTVSPKGEIEYLFAPTVTEADAFAREHGWRPGGRVTWFKRDGTVVYFLSLLVQLEIVSAGEIVHVIGHAPEPLRKLKRIGAIAICHQATQAAYTHQRLLNLASKEET